MIGLSISNPRAAKASPGRVVALFHANRITFDKQRKAANHLTVLNDRQRSCILWPFRDSREPPLEVDWRLRMLLRVFHDRARYEQYDKSSKTAESNTCKLRDVNCLIPVNVNGQAFEFSKGFHSIIPDLSTCKPTAPSPSF